MPLIRNPKIEIYETHDALTIATAELLTAVSQRSIEQRGLFTLVLSGGQTPETLFTLLAEKPYRDIIQWEKTVVFWADERYVPLNDERNNAFRALNLLLNKVSIPSENIHRMLTHMPPQEAAQAYQDELHMFFHTQSPRFDFILLGLGENGHTASLFPFTEVLQEKSEGVRSVFIAGQNMDRITMTAPLINQARIILFLVSGKQKSVIVKEILSGDTDFWRLPAQLIKPVDGKLIWYMDEAAASLLP